MGPIRFSSSTFNGMISNLQDYIGEAQRLFAQPLFEELKVELENLIGPNGLLNSEEGKRQLADMAASVGDATRETVATIRENWPEI